MINESWRCSVTALLHFGLDARDKCSLLRQKPLAAYVLRFCSNSASFFDFHGYLFGFQNVESVRFG